MQNEPPKKYTAVNVSSVQEKKKKKKTGNLIETYWIKIEDKVEF